LPLTFGASLRGKKIKSKSGGLLAGLITTERVSL
jgi:hypothetical protein